MRMEIIAYENRHLRLERDVRACFIVHDIRITRAIGWPCDGFHLLRIHLLVNDCHADIVQCVCSVEFVLDLQGNDNGTG